MQKKKPNFIIIGAMKAATTSLYTYLKQHPDIFMTKVKEPMFFNNFNQEKDYKIIGSKSKKVNTLEGYFSLFDDVKNEKAIGEASPAYIYNEKAPSLISDILDQNRTGRPGDHMYKIWRSSEHYCRNWSYFSRSACFLYNVKYI